MPRGRMRGRSRLEALTLNDMTKELSFAERTALLRQTAFDVKHAAEIVLAEVQRMEAAQERFAHRSTRRDKQTASR